MSVKDFQYAVERPTTWTHTIWSDDVQGEIELWDERGEFNAMVSKWFDQDEYVVSYYHEHRGPGELPEETKWNSLEAAKAEGERWVNQDAV